MRNNVFFNRVVHRSKHKVHGINIIRTTCGLDVALSVVRDATRTPFFACRTDEPVDCVLCLAEEP